MQPLMMICSLRAKPGVDLVGLQGITAKPALDLVGRMGTKMTEIAKLAEDPVGNRRSAKPTLDLVGLQRITAKPAVDLVGLQRITAKPALDLVARMGTNMAEMPIRAHPVTTTRVVAGV